MERNIKVFRAHRALSWLYILGMALMIFVAITTPAILKEPAIYLLSGFFVILFFVHQVTARGARESKPWARTSSIVISVILLFGFPLGTLIGIYLLSNTWRKWDDISGVNIVGA